MTNNKDELKLTESDFEDIYRLQAGEGTYRLNQQDLHPGLETTDRLFEGAGQQEKVYLAEDSYMVFLKSGLLDPGKKLTLYTPADSEDLAEENPQFNVSNFSGNRYITPAVEIYFETDFDDSVALEIIGVAPDNIEVHLPTWDSFASSAEDILEEMEKF